MKIEIQSIKITFKKWWHLALNIAVAVLCFKAPELVVRLLLVIPRLFAMLAERMSNAR